MEITETTLPGVLILEPTIFGDDRGFFFESFNSRTFAKIVGSEVEFVQDNHSKSSRGVLRGLHYQVRQAQGKLVRALEGAVYDVAVDIRVGSPTFGKWTGVELSSENKKQLWIPPGFAHGFIVTTESAQVLYKVTQHYAPEYERSLRWDDPDIGVNWPNEFSDPLLSDKDFSACWLADAELPTFGS